MRKLIVLPVAALLALAIAAPVSAGANVVNSSSSAMTAQGSWYSDTAGESSGSLFAWQDSGSPSAYLEFYEDSGQYVDCTPADDTDDFFGFQGQYRSGFGEGTLSIGRGLGDAHVSSTLEVYLTVVDECAGTYVESTIDGVAVSLDLVATGPKMTERGTWSFKIPSQYNTHSSYSTTARSAAGTATIGSAPGIAVDGGIGKVSWRDHGNG